MKCVLGDIADVTMGQSPKSEFYNSEGNGMPFLQGNRTFGKRYPVFDTFTTMPTKTAKAGDIIMSVRAPVGDLNFTPVDMCLGRGVCGIRMKNGNQDFLFYLLKYYMPQLLNKESGTVFGSVNRNDINGLEIDIPNDALAQQRIARILAMLDEKTEENDAINENLLQQALCIYTSLINGKSKNGCIGDYCALKSGFAFKSKWWQDSGVPVVKIGSINQDYLDLSDCSYVSEDKISLAKDFIVSGGDLLIAMTGATIGKFTMVPKTTETILVNQRVGKFFLGNDPVSRISFMYCTLKQPEVISEVINRGQGSAQPNISASDIMSIPCVIPQPVEINAFNEMTAPMFELIINNQFENIVLANTRDSLLPRLMSGELIVSELDL